jgi:hypothetical protein
VNLQGGFGSLLRGAGKGGRITNNDDACRDLSGRRLRGVNAEAKLQEWVVRLRWLAPLRAQRAALRARARRAQP